jgi:hypothetical protein
MNTHFGICEFLELRSGRFDWPLGECAIEHKPIFYIMLSICSAAHTRTARLAFPASHNAHMSTIRTIKSLPGFGLEVPISNFKFEAARAFKYQFQPTNKHDLQVGGSIN